MQQCNAYEGTMNDDKCILLIATSGPSGDDSNRFEILSNRVDASSLHTEADSKNTFRCAQGAASITC